MLIEEPIRKNSLKKMSRSKSEVIKLNFQANENQKISNHKFRRRSLMMKNVKIED